MPPGNLMMPTVFFGSTSGGSGGGGNILANVYVNTVNAEIKSGAVVYGETLAVTADTDLTALALAPISGYSEEGASINIALSGIVAVNTTAAHIDGDAVITTGDNLIGDTDATVIVSAIDNTIAINVTGGLAMGRSAGVGINLAGNVIIRDTNAFIGDPDATVTGTGSVTSNGNVRVAADNKGVIVAGSVTAAVSGQTDLGDKMLKTRDKIDTSLRKFNPKFSQSLTSALKSPSFIGAAIGGLFLPVIGPVIALVVGGGQFFSNLGSWDPADPGGKGLTPEGGDDLLNIVDPDNPAGNGQKPTKPPAYTPDKSTGAENAEYKLPEWAVSGAANVTTSILYNAAQAGVANATVDAADLAIIAENKTAAGSLSGSVAVANKSEKQSVGVGASIASYIEVAATTALIDNSEITLSGDLAVKADRGGAAGSLAASGAVTKTEKGKSAGVAFSTAANFLISTTRSYITDSTITAGNDVTVSATTGAVIGAAAGSFVGRGQAAVGPAIAFNLAVETTEACIVDSDVTATSGDLTLTARNTQCAGQCGCGRGGLQGRCCGSCFHFRKYYPFNHPELYCHHGFVCRTHH